MNKYYMLKFGSLRSRRTAISDLAETRVKNQEFLKFKLSSVLHIYKTIITTLKEKNFIPK